MIPSTLASATKLTGRLVAECRDGEGRLVWREDINNGVTTEGRNHLLDVGFHGASQAGAWYLVLIDADGYTGVDGGDTLASHDGWAEFTDYSGNRPEWTEGAASDGTIANASPVTYTFSGAGAIKGAFLASAATGTTGVLYATALFGSDKPVADGYTLNLTYSVSLTS